VCAMYCQGKSPGVYNPRVPSPRRAQKMPSEGEITRRLSFSDVSLHTSNDLNKLNVLTAMNHPTQANFRRCAVAGRRLGALAPQLTSRANSISYGTPGETCRDDGEKQQRSGPGGGDAIVVVIARGVLFDTRTRNVGGAPHSFRPLPPIR